MEIQPLNEHVLVQVLENKNEGQGIILPNTHQNEKFGVGVVIAADEELPIKPGDKVLFDTLLLINVKIEGRGEARGQTEELQFIKFSDLLGYER